MQSINFALYGMQRARIVHLVVESVGSENTMMHSEGVANGLPV
jgi:hypothetical protein